MIIAVNFPIGKKKPERFPPRIPMLSSTICAMKPHIRSELNLLTSYLPSAVKWHEVYMKLDALGAFTRASLRVCVLDAKYKNKWMNHDILARLYYSSVYPFMISGFVWYPPNPVASCEFQPVWFKNQAQLSTHLWRTCLPRIFQVFLQLMAITLYMLVEIVRSSFTGRGDPSELCNCTSLPTKTNHDKTTV